MSNAEVGKVKADVRGQMTDGREQKTEGFDCGFRNAEGGMKRQRAESIALRKIFEIGAGKGKAEE